MISGEWQSQMRIPSENELVESLRISRMTIHRALRELTAEGRLTRVQGVGTFVAKAKPQATLLNVRSIAEEIASMGGVHSSRIVLLKAERIGDGIAASMELLPKSEIFHAVVVHRNRGVPIQLEDRYVNPATAPEFIQQDFTKITTSEYLLATAPLDEVEHIVEVAMPDLRIRKLLEIPATEPCLVLHRKTWSRGIVATLSRFFYPGSRYRLHGRFNPSKLSKLTTT